MGVGIHIIADFYGVDSELIATTERMFPIIEGAVEYGRLTKISSDYYQFRPRGASGIVLDKLRPTSISTRKIIRGDMIEEAGENQIEEAAFH